MTDILKFDELPVKELYAKEKEFVDALQDVSTYIEKEIAGITKPKYSKIDVKDILKTTAKKGYELANYYSVKHPMNFGLSSRLHQEERAYDLLAKFVRYSEAALPHDYANDAFKTIRERLNDSGIDPDKIRLDKRSMLVIKAIGKALPPKELER